MAYSLLNECIKVIHCIDSINHEILSSHCTDNFWVYLYDKHRLTIIKGYHQRFFQKPEKVYVVYSQFASWVRPKLFHLQINSVSIMQTWFIEDNTGLNECHKSAQYRGDFRASPWSFSYPLFYKISVTLSPLLRQNICFQRENSYCN